MNKRERFKRLIHFLANAVVVLVEVAIFSYIWYNLYSKSILEPFWRRGNWAVIGMYALLSY